MSSSVVSRISSSTATTSSVTSDATYRNPKRIFVTIPSNTDEASVFGLFQPYGCIRRVVIRRDSEGKSRGFAFVTFQRHEDAAAALKELQGTKYDNMILHLDWAQPPRHNKQDEPQRNHKRGKRNGSAKRRNKNAD